MHLNSSLRFGVNKNHCQIRLSTELTGKFEHSCHVLSRNQPIINGIEMTRLVLIFSMTGFDEVFSRMVCAFAE